MEVLFRLSVLDLQQRGVSERAAIYCAFYHSSLRDETT
jgi:hypothetical protein